MRRQQWIVWLTVGGVILGGVLAAKAVGTPLFSPPATGTVEGPLRWVDVASPAPRLGVEMGDGLMVVMPIDPEQTPVSISGRPIPLAELRPGQWVKVHYTVKDGQQITTSIVGESPTVTFPPPQ